MSKRFLSGINVTGTATLNTVANAGLDTDKFLVLDAAGNIDFRTGDELKIDIGANVVSRIEHEVKLGETMSIGTPVYVGVDLNAGTNMTVYKASNATEARSSKTMGLVASSGITNDLVEVITEGLLEGLNTSTATKGDPVWLGVDGALIFGLVNKPVAPAHLVSLGVVTRVQQNNGEIFVKVQNGFEMNEIHNYLEGSVQNNQVIVYESATSLYKPKTIPTILGYTPVPNSRTLTINGTTYDLTADRSWTISANQNARTEYEFTTNGSTATYSATYTVGQVDVFYNGSKLSSAEFTATNGTSVTLAFTPPSGQLVEVVAWETGGGVANGRTLTINGTAYDLSANRSWTIDNASLGAQPQLNGTGFVKASGTTITYDNSTYLTTTSASSTYLAKTGGVLTGSLGINSNGLTGYSFRNSKNLTGFSTTYANSADGIIQSDATGISHYYFSEANVAAGASITGIYHFKATQNLFGAGSSVDVQAGLVIDYSLSGAGTNYGIISNIPSADNNWNLYIGGSAKNWISSSLGIGAGAVSPTATLDVNGTLKASGAATFSSNIGLGAISNWGTPFKVIQGGSYGQYIGFQTNVADMKIGVNHYYNNGYIYTTTDKAAQINISSDNGFQFNLAPSGTAGNAVSFTTAMSITTGGYVGIGTTGPAYKLDVFESSGSLMQLYQNDGTYNRRLIITTNATGSNRGVTLNATSSTGGDNMIFLTASSEAMRLTSQGRLGINQINPLASLHITAPFGLNNEAFRMGWDGVAGLVGTLTKTDGQPYVSYYFNNGNIAVGTATTVGRIHATGSVVISNNQETFRRALLNYGQTGTYSQVKVFFNKSNWGSVTYDIKLASAGGSYHTAGAYYSNPGFSSHINSINAGNGPTMTLVADSQTGSTQGAVWTFSGVTMIHPMVTIDIACGNGYQIDPNDVVVQFI